MLVATSRRRIKWFACATDMAYQQCCHQVALQSSTRVAMASQRRIQKLNVPPEVHTTKVELDIPLLDLYNFPTFPHHEVIRSCHPQRIVDKRGSAT